MLTRLTVVTVWQNVRILKPGGGHGHPLHYACLENPMDTAEVT